MVGPDKDNHADYEKQGKKKKKAILPTGFEPRLLGVKSFMLYHCATYTSQVKHFCLCMNVSHSKKVILNHFDKIHLVRVEAKLFLFKYHGIVVSCFITR